MNFLYLLLKKLNTLNQIPDVINFVLMLFFKLKLVFCSPRKYLNQSVIEE